MSSRQLRPLIVAGLLCGWGAVAGSTLIRAANAPAEGASDNALEEIVITAEKRSASALTTPIALSAYDSDALKEAQVVTVADLQNIDPSINVAKGGFGDTVTIRGVTSVDTTSKGSPGIAFNIDGVPINRGYEQAEAFFDLERVEVLKGPQGTLYGASSTGGALNIITAKPRNVFEASSDLTVGNYNTRRTTDVLNVPLADWIAVRAAVNYNFHDGYSVLADGTPYTNGESNLTSRLSTLLTFSGDANLILQLTNGNIGGPGSAGVNYSTLLSAPTGSAQRVVYESPFPQRLNDTFSNLNAQFNWSLGGVQLTYVGGYLNFSADEHSAGTANPLANNGNVLPLPQYGWRDYRGHALTNSHELRLANRNPGALDWVVGVNWFRENLHESDHNWNATAPSADSLPTVEDSVNGIDPLNNTIHTTKGLFGQVTWHATSKLDLTAGVRESRDALNRYGTFAFGAGPPGGPPWPNPSGTPCVAPEDCVGSPNNGAENDSKATYRGNVAYHFTPTQMVFATVATGFKGGGFNDFCAPVPPATVGGPCPYAPEELTSYELGYKGRPLDNFEFNSDLYYYDYSNRQFSQLVIIGGSGVISTTLTPAVIEGWENELTFRPTSADEFHLNIALMRSHYVSLVTYSPMGPPAGIPGSVPVDLSGRTLDNTPSFASTLGYSHTFPLSNGASFRIHADSKYSSSYYQTNIGPFYSYTQPSFTRSNADLRYTTDDGRFSVGAYVTNIENKLQITGAPGGNPAPIPASQAVGATDPRTWGFTMSVKF